MTLADALARIADLERERDGWKRHYTDLRDTTNGLIERNGDLEREVATRGQIADDYQRQRDEAVREVARLTESDKRLKQLQKAARLLIDGLSGRTCPHCASTYTWLTYDTQPYDVAVFCVDCGQRVEG